jgi:hypothetical protein
VYRYPRTFEKAQPVSIEQAFAALKDAMRADVGGYAWSWHCNIAMPIYDAMGGDDAVSQETRTERHRLANMAAARVMSMIFGVDMRETVLYREIVNGPESYQMTSKSPRDSQLRLTEPERLMGRQLITADEAIPDGMMIYKSGHYGEEEAVIVQPKCFKPQPVAPLPPKLAVRERLMLAKYEHLDPVVKPPLAGWNTQA